MRTPGRLALLLASFVGTVHASFSAYWASGGSWLLNTLGGVVDTFRGVEWLLWIVAAFKLAAAVVPARLGASGWPAGRFWRPLCWVGAVVLVGWGGVNTVVSNLVLAGVIRPADGSDRAAMVGHAWLWDPLFLLWGLALGVGLWLSRASGDDDAPPAYRPARVARFGR